MALIGIRREDKSLWEARAPLVPDDVRRLIREQGLQIAVQSAPNRAFSDEAYRQAGAVVTDDLRDCPVILGVKEIPPEWFEADKTYVFFSHTIKGQPDNMPALRQLLELNCQLVDYEKITDDQNRRLVFFGRYAGLAGMIDTLWALGQRLEHEGIQSPFSAVQPAHHYADLAAAEQEIRAVGERIATDGLPEVLQPLVCGFAGYGQVSQGAQEVFDLLPVKEITAAELGDVPADPHQAYKVVFREEHLVDRIDASKPFQLQEYYDDPSRYRSSFYQHAQHLTVLVNCIYWDERYPRLITREQFRELYAGSQIPRLRVVGDITCDIDGSLGCTVHATTPDSPVYVFDPVTGRATDGVTGPGPVVLAVDFLPCELPVDASRAFSQAIMPFVPALAGADFSMSLQASGLPPELARATIVYQGELTRPYRDLDRHVKG